jgi:hypothetical protein
MRAIRAMFVPLDSRMGEILIPKPYFALIPAVVFIAMAKLSRLRLLYLAGGVWAFYSVYEYLMKFRILCSGECNIRIDLLAIYPFLIFLTAAASLYVIYGIATRKRREQSTM